MGIAKMTDSKKRSEQGGTLVEVMITSLILAIVIVGSMAIFAKCNIFANGLREHSIINNALNERMEEIRGMAFSSVLVLPSTFTATGFVELTPNATGTLVLEDTFSDTNIRKVTLTASWTGQEGRSMTKSMAAYVTSNGINKQ